MHNPKPLTPLSRMMPETLLEALPIGTERVWNRQVRKQIHPQRFIKVSHHGARWSRWRPFARHWWERNVGPIPEGYQVYHRDGDTLHDDPANYVLCRADRFKLIFATLREASRTQKRRRSKAIAKANRRRGSIARAQVKESYWYLVLPESRAVVWQANRYRRGARRLVVAEQLAALCRKDITRIADMKAEPYQPGHAAQVVLGSDLIRGSCPGGPYEGFVRLIPDERRAPKRRQATPSDNFVEVLAGQ